MWKKRLIKQRFIHCIHSKQKEKRNKQKIIRRKKTERRDGFNFVVVDVSLMLSFDQVVQEI